MPSARNTTVVAMLVALIAALVGCATNPARIESRSDPDRAPADFVLAVTVFAPRDGGPLDRPTRFVLEPDGVLRAAFGEGAGGQTFPQRTRPLDAEQVRRVHELADQAGLADPPETDRERALASAAAIIQTSHRLGPAAGAVVAATSVAANGERRHRAFQSQDRARLTPLIDELARLVWR